MPHSHTDYPLVDLALARRLERTEARANAAYVTTRARRDPAVGATWTEIAGAYAMFDGAGSMLTQSFGLGLFADPSDADLDALEAFFRDRGADVNHEVSPLMDAGLLPRLTGRGYRPVELSSILYRPVPREPAAAPAGDGLRVRRVGEEEADLWARVSADGWRSESPELAGFVLERGR